MSYVLEQIRTLREIMKSKSDIKVVLALALFLLINVLKITLFNFCLIEKHNRMVFEYKAGMTLLLILIVYTIILSLKSRAVFLVFYILQVVYILVNISYYLYFHSYLHILQFIMLFSEGFAAAGHSAAPISIKFLIAFIDLPVFIYIFVNYKNIYKTRVKLRFFRYLLVLASVVIFISIETFNYVHDYSLVNFVKSRFVGEALIVERYGTVINNAVGFYLKRNDKAMIDRLEYGQELKNDEEVSEKPNIVYIQVESMDANVINQKYKGEYIAPNLHELAQKNVYYPYVLSYHMGGGTSDSEFSVINSIEPVDGYPAMKIANYSHPNSFVKILSNNSYKTMAFHGNSGGFFNRNVAFPKMGFEEYYDMVKMNLEHVGWGAPDRDVFNNALIEFGKAKQPFFSYVITMTSHGPFTNASNYYNNARYSDIKTRL
jgi:phosphoglycerol transferase MdoB-like AlkP superfamily enzyme